MLQRSAQSGYAIKSAANTSMSFFWRASFSQIYPELATLERHGFVTRHDDPRGARVRSLYEITASGEAALLAWLRSANRAPPQFRDEGLLQLYFADALAPEEQLTLVKELRERVSIHREPISNGFGQTDQGDAKFPRILAQLEADTTAYIEQWFRRLEASLEDTCTAACSAGPDSNQKNE
jgi:DNA-binding PadR family transcriptional regulator